MIWCGALFIAWGLAVEFAGIEAWIGAIIVGCISILIALVLGDRLR